MDEIFLEIQDMMSDVFNQGMAYQRIQDAQKEFEDYATTVVTKWATITGKLQPEEGEQTQ